MKKFIFCILFVGICLPFVQAQNVNISEDPGIKSMMDRMVQINWMKETVTGWRVQILATTDRKKMEDVKSEFLSRYPNVPIDWVHAKPYYKLRAGAYATKLEAIKLLHQLKRAYPSAYPARDSGIDPRELVGL